ncbi:MAG TPA: hypothetical protein VM074_07040 [Solimonas sp.]|nr:hypothetical protein [Solimonas sp.]
MMKRNSVTLMAAALALGFGSQAFAEHDAKTRTDKGIPGIEVNKVPGDRAGVPGVDVDITARLGSLDKDGDSLISRSEAAPDSELKAQFRTLDKNHNGKLDKNEYVLFKAKVAAGAKDNHGTDVSAVAREKDDGGLPGIDVDRVPGDRTGVPGVDVNITAGAGKAGKAKGAAAKDNHGTDVSAVAREKDDGGLPGIDVDRVPGDRVGLPGIDVDLTARAGKIDKLDKNGDRQISKAEAAADAKLKAQFATLDTNNDGKLDTAEFARFEVKVDKK